MFVVVWLLKRHVFYLSTQSTVLLPGCSEITPGGFQGNVCGAGNQTGVSHLQDGYLQPWTTSLALGLSLFLFLVGATVDCAQRAHLAGLVGPCGVLGIKPRPSTCEASTLPAV